VNCDTRKMSTIVLYCKKETNNQVLLTKDSGFVWAEDCSPQILITSFRLRDEVEISAKEAVKQLVGLTRLPSRVIGNSKEASVLIWPDERLIKDKRDMRLVIQVGEKTYDTFVEGLDARTRNIYEEYLKRRLV